MVSWPSQQSSTSTASSSATTTSATTTASDVQLSHYWPKPYSNPHISPYPLPPRTRCQQFSRPASSEAAAAPPVPCRSRCHWGVLALPRPGQVRVPTSSTCSTSSTTSPNGLAAYSPSLTSPAFGQASQHSIPQADIDALELIYIDPAYQAHVGQQAPESVNMDGQRFFDFVHPDDVQQAQEDMADLLGPSRTTFGSVIRCRFADVAAFGNIISHTQSGPNAWQSTAPSTITTYPTVDLVISYIGDGLALCFIHNVLDESPQDCDEHNKSPWTNWCGMPAESFSPQEADKLWRQIYRKRGAFHSSSSPEHIFQILRVPKDGGDVLFSWPAPRLFPPTLENSDKGVETAIADSALVHYQDGSYFADDFAALAQGLDNSLFALSDASTTCTRRLRAKHTLTTDGLMRTVESVVIGYGDVIIAMFSNTVQQRLGEIPSAATLTGLNMHLPAFVPVPSQLQPMDAQFAANAGALAVPSQVALMSQSPTTLSPVLLQHTFSPSQANFSIGDPYQNTLGFSSGFVAPFHNLPLSAPAGATTFFQGNTDAFSYGSHSQGQDSHDSSMNTDSARPAKRRSFDEAALVNRSRHKSMEGVGMPEDRRMSDTAFAHRRATTFDPDAMQGAASGSTLSQHQQLMLDVSGHGADEAPPARRFRNPSYASFASSSYSQTLSTIDSTCDPLDSSVTSSGTMFSPPGSIKWNSAIMSEHGSMMPTLDHRESFASSIGSTTGLDAAAMAAAVSAAAAAGARRRSRQDTWPLVRIEDENVSDMSVIMEKTNLAARTRSRSAAVWQTGTTPTDPSSAAAAVAAATGSTGASADASSGPASMVAGAASSLMSMGVPGNSLNPFASMPSPTSGVFAFETSPEVRSTVELAPAPGSSTASIQYQLSSNNPFAKADGLHQGGVGTSMLSDNFDPNAGIIGNGPYVTSFAPHARALSAPGLELGNGMPHATGEGRSGEPSIQVHHHHAVDQQLNHQQNLLHHSYGLQHHGGHGHHHPLGLAPKMCASCGTTNSPEWRRGPTGHKTLCNACGLRFSRSVIRAKKREEKRKASEPSLRRASEVAAAATTAAAAASAAAAAAASSSNTSSNRYIRSIPLKS
ncbi:hypothetical protein V8E36_005710 [Tilletia maclaganii]